ncbi:MAG TPA: DUF4142 domain-containing protein [Verrucomicrobiae bacterium]
MKNLAFTKLFVLCGVSTVAAFAMADDMNTRTPAPATPPPPAPETTPSTTTPSTPPATAPSTTRSTLSSLKSSMMPLTPQKFVTDAALGNMKEIVLGNEALQRSQNADVKNFAATIVRDHTANNAQLEAIATQEGLQMPSTNTFSADDPVWENPVVKSDQTIKGQGAQLLTSTNWPYLSEYLSLQHLKTLSGPAFDQAYLSDMVSDHAQDITKFETASRELTDPQLKQYATSTLPTLRQHYHMAQQLAAKFATAPANNTKMIMESAATPGGR